MNRQVVPVPTPNVLRSPALPNTAFVGLHCAGICSEVSSVRVERVLAQVALRTDGDFCAVLLCDVHPRSVATDWSTSLVRGRETAVKARETSQPTNQP